MAALRQRYGRSAGCPHSTLLFVSPPGAGTDGRPLKTLAGFARTEGRSQRISFNLTALDLSIVDAQGNRTALAGSWNVTVGLPGVPLAGPSATTLVSVRRGAERLKSDDARGPPARVSVDWATPAGVGVSRTITTLQVVNNPILDRHFTVNGTVFPNPIHAQVWGSLRNLSKAGLQMARFVPWYPYPRKDIGVRVSSTGGRSWGGARCV